MPRRHEVETRDLEYFVVLAEELHFGRAAARLSIAQPGLSKALRRLEVRLGLQLLVRDRRQVSLTPAGEALLEDGRGALEAVGTAVRRAVRADAEAPVRLVMKAGGDGNLLPSILAAYAEEPDHREVEIVFGGIRDRIDFLRDGRADVAILYHPLDDLSGLDHVTLLTENRLAILARDHPLAGREELFLADLKDEILPRWKDMGEDSGGPEVADMAELTHLIALGRAIAILPPSAIGAMQPGIVAVPISDAPPNRLLLAWARQNRPSHVRSLIRAATAVTDGARSEVA